MAPAVSPGALTTTRVGLRKNRLDHQDDRLQLPVERGVDRIEPGVDPVDRASTVANKLTATNVIVGTPAYVAPERVTGDRYDGRADVYSVGVLVYEMLTGHLPIEHGPQAIGLAAFIKQATQAARPMSDWLPGVPDEVEALVMRALARDPALRPTAGELRDELRRLERRSIHARFAKAVPVS